MDSGIRRNDVEGKGLYPRLRMKDEGLKEDQGLNLSRRATLLQNSFTFYVLRFRYYGLKIKD